MKTPYLYGAATVALLTAVAPAAPVGADAGTAPTDAETAPLPTLDALQQMTTAQRKAAVKKLSREQLDTLMRGAPLDALIRIGRKSLGELGTYRLRLVKRERVGGNLLEAQEIEGTVREKPFAVRLNYVKGPAAGRKVLYSRDLNPGGMRVREAGILGVLPIWVAIDSSLARGDSNHSITEMGFGALLDRFDRDLKAVSKYGGFSVKVEGFDARGLYCQMFITPKSMPNAYSESNRICIDPGAGLPLKVEAFDSKGLMETYSFFDVAPVKLEPDHFTLEKAGL